MVRKVEKLDNSFNKYGMDVVAKPVDTYVTPARVGDAGGSYQQLAVALAGLHTPLAKYAKNQWDEKAETDRAKGEQAYQQNGDRKSWEDYINQNKELPHNPFIKEGYLKARASNEAQQLKQEMYQAYATAKITGANGEEILLKDSDDPAAFDAWSRNYTNSYIEKNMGKDSDPLTFSKIFLPQAETMIATLAGDHIEQRQLDTNFKNIAEHTKLIQNLVTDRIKDSAFILGGEDGTKELAGRISIFYSDMVNSGIPKEQARNAIFTAITGLADKDGIEDMSDLLQVIDNIDMGDGLKFGNVPELRAKTEQYFDDASRQKEEKILKAEREKEKARKETVETTELTIYEDIFKSNRLMNDTDRKKLQEAGATASEIHTIFSMSKAVTAARKPEVDHYAQDRWERQRDAEARYRFTEQVLRQGGNYTVEDVRKSGMDPNSRAGAIQGLINKTPTLDDVISQNSTFIDTTLATRIFGGKGRNDSPSLPSTYAYVRGELEEQFRERVTKDPTILTNMARIDQTINNIITKNKKEWEQIPAVMVNPPKDIGNKKDVLQQGSKRKIYTENAKSFAEMAANHNKSVLSGKDPQTTPLGKWFQKGVTTPAEFEANTGIKINMAPPKKPNKPKITEKLRDKGDVSR